MRRLVAVAAALLLAASLAGPVAASSPTFEQPTAVSTFGREIAFGQAFDSPIALARVEVLLDFPAGLGPLVVQVAGATPAGRHELTEHWLLGSDGFLSPNTPVIARWRLVPADRSVAPSVGPPVRVVYADTRFDWRTLEGSVVRLHWYEGSTDFGRRALSIGEKGVGDAAAFLGVSETAPIDFYVYADQAAFYDALGPGTRENVGGEAHADIRTMFALITPADLGAAWVGIVIPHELTHLVFDTAVRNPYHFPPRWLDEGVAVHLSQGYDSSDRSAVSGAVADDRLMPLEALDGQFPTSADRFYLAYAEASSAVDFLVRTHGSDALVRLIRSYAGGVTDDEAFRAAIGQDVAGFEAAWLADLGAAPQRRFGPVAAPAGPLPPGWTASGPDGAPAPTGGPGATGRRGQGPSAAPAPGSPAGAPGAPGEWWPIVAAAAAGLLVGGAIAWIRRRRAAPPAGPGPAGDGAGGAGP